MLKENWRKIQRIQKIGDLLITLLSFYLAYYLRNFLFTIEQQFRPGTIFNYQQLAEISAYYPILVIALITLFVFLNLSNAYGSMRYTSGRQLLKLFILAGLTVFIVIAAALFLLKADFSRAFISIFCGLLAILLTLQRLIVLRILRYWRRKGLNFRNIIICGLNKQALRLAKEINQHSELGIRIRGYASLHENTTQELEAFKASLSENNCNPRNRIITQVDGMASALKEYAIDEVIFADITPLTSVEDVVNICAEQGVRTTIAADLFSIGIAKSALSYFGSIPLIHFQPPPGDRWELGLKRILDIVVSAILLIALSPIMLLIAIAVKLTSPGSIFFIQKRVGMNGHLFDLYKFRSMQMQAEDQLANLRAENEMDGPAFKLKDDPRITPLGRFLRKHSLDELPQLWNVLIGQMSLVGPRPPIPTEVGEYQRYYRRRLSMRPGLTCTWQVSGRNKISNFEDWVKLDLEYIDNWSFSRDIALIFRTIPTVLLGSGGR